MELQRNLARTAIGDIAHDRTAQYRAMHPDLMGAAGARPELEPGAAIMGAEYAVIGDRRLAGGVDHHMPADPSGLLAQGGLDAAFRLGRHRKKEAPKRLQFPFRRVLIQRDELVSGLPEIP